MNAFTTSIRAVKMIFAVASLLLAMHIGASAQQEVPAEHVDGSGARPAQKAAKVRKQVASARKTSAGAKPVMMAKKGSPSEVTAR